MTNKQRIKIDDVENMKFDWLYPNPLKLRYKVDKPEHRPFKKYKSDAGFDVYSDENVVIPANSYALVKTDLRVAIPYGYVGFLKPRSGLSSKHGCNVGAGVIDSNYRGYISVLLFNHGNENIVIKTDMKIAQLVILPVLLPELEEVEEFEETDRGKNGFGSTGI